MPRHEVGIQLVAGENPVAVDEFCSRASSGVIVSMLKTRVLVLERELIVVIFVQLGDSNSLGRENDDATKLAHSTLLGAEF